MNKEDKKLQEYLVNEMMKASETNPDVIIYMQSLMKCYEELEQENQQLKKQKDELEKENNELQKAYELIDKSMYEFMKQKDDVVEYINFLYIINQNINGKFSDTLWGKEILELLGEIDE